MRVFLLLLVMAVLGFSLWLASHAAETAERSTVDVGGRAPTSESTVPTTPVRATDPDAGRREFPEQEPEPAVLDVARTPVPVAVDVDLRGTALADPVLIGNCALVLTLVDRRTRRRMASEITLWRIDAPASGNRTRGDQPQHQVKVPSNGMRFEHLVAGDYRAVCHAERADASDPPAFRVEGRETRVTLELALPAKRRAWLVLYDEDGSLIREAEMRVGARISRPKVVGTRDWVKRRKILGATQKSAGNPRRSGGSRSDSTHRSWVGVRAGVKGFDLGSFPGDPRHVHVHQAIEFRVRDGRSATVHVHGKHHGERVYYSVMPRRGRVLDALELPGRNNGHAIAKEVTVEGRELLAGQVTTGEPWREVPIYVLVHHPDYQRLSFTFRLGDGPLATRRVRIKVR